MRHIIVLIIVKVIHPIDFGGRRGISIKIKWFLQNYFLFQTKTFIKAWSFNDVFTYKIQKLQHEQ